MFAPTGYGPHRFVNQELVRAKILVPSSARLVTGRAQGANRPRGGFPPPSLKGRDLSFTRMCKSSEMGSKVGQSEWEELWLVGTSSANVRSSSVQVAAASFARVKPGKVGAFEDGARQSSG